MPKTCEKMKIAGKKYTPDYEALTYAPNVQAAELVALGEYSIKEGFETIHLVSTEYTEIYAVTANIPRLSGGFRNLSCTLKRSYVLPSTGKVHAAHTFVQIFIGIYVNNTGQSEVLTHLEMQPLKSCPVIRLG